jgi:hypothetical protein
LPSPPALVNGKARPRRMGAQAPQRVIELEARLLARALVTAN